MKQLLYTSFLSKQSHQHWISINWIVSVMDPLVDLVVNLEERRLAVMVSYEEGAA